MFLDRPILAIFAHPDDESFIVGGALTFAARKTQVKIIVATRGEKGKRYIDYEIGDENLAAMRRRELEDAAKALGIKDFIVWDYKDGQLDQADEKEIVARLVNEIRAFSPESVLTFGPDGMTAHRDHIAIGKFATKAVAQLGNVELFWVARPRHVIESNKWHRNGAQYTKASEVPYNDDELIRIDVSDVIDSKVKAISSHASQGPGRYLASGMKELISSEYFYKVKEKILKSYRYSE